MKPWICTFLAGVWYSQTPWWLLMALKSCGGRVDFIDNSWIKTWSKTLLNLYFSTHTHTHTQSSFKTIWKGSKTIRKSNKDMNGEFVENHIKMVLWSTLLIIRGMQIKTTLRYVFPSSVWWRSRLIASCADQSMRNRCSYTLLEGE